MSQPVCRSQSIICAFIFSLSVYHPLLFMLNRLSSRMFTQSLRTGTGFNSSWNSVRWWPHTVTFISLFLVFPHSLFPRAEGSFWTETLKKQVTLSHFAFFFSLLLSLVSLSALLTAQEGVCCLLKLSCARNMFTVVMYKKHTLTRTHSYSLVLTWHKSLQSKFPNVLSL